MPLEFQVLQCYSCKTFQVHQVKKAKKWACKMCGEKQSIIKVFGRGTGAECRQHVQSLNTHRGEIDMLKETLKCTESLQEASNYHSDDQDKGGNVQESGNKWSQFVDKTSYVDEDGDNNVSSYDDMQFTTDASILDKKGKSRKRKREYSVHQSREKSSRFDDFIEQQEIYDEVQSSYSRYPSKQGSGKMGQYSAENRNRANIDNRQFNKFHMTNSDTASQCDTQNLKQNYKGGEIDCHGNMNVQENQRIQCTGPWSSKWSSFGKNYLQQNMYHLNKIQACPDDINRLEDQKSSAPTSNKWSNWHMHEEHSS